MIRAVGIEESCDHCARCCPWDVGGCVGCTAQRLAAPVARHTATCLTNLPVWSHTASCRRLFVQDTQALPACRCWSCVQPRPSSFNEDAARAQPLNKEERKRSLAQAGRAGMTPRPLRLASVARHAPLRPVQRQPHRDRASLCETTDCHVPQRTSRRVPDHRTEGQV